MNNEEQFIFNNDTFEEQEIAQVSALLENEAVLRKHREKLAKQKLKPSLEECIECDGSIPAFDLNEIHKYLKKIDGWNVQNNEKKSYYLIKDFKFKDFLESQNFVNKVGNLAEAEGHHPDISFGWGYCKIKIFTHAIKGLAESDFILAAKIDKI